MFFFYDNIYIYIVMNIHEVSFVWKVLGKSDPVSERAATRRETKMGELTRGSVRSWRRRIKII